MPRHTDGSLMTKEQLKEENIKRFNEAIASGNLYNTGPKTEEGGTSFSPERWDIYFKSNPEDKPDGYTNQKSCRTGSDDTLKKKVSAEISRIVPPLGESGSIIGCRRRLGC